MVKGSGVGGPRWWVPATLAVLGALVPLLLISPDLPCDSDEAHHVMLGLKYQRDVSHGDLAGFVRHSLKTGRYPFLHGWYVAGAFAVFGPGYLVARATSAVLLGAAAALAALLLFRIRPGAHPLWGLLAGLVTILAPETMSNAVLCMLEVPGVFLMLLGAWAYHRFADEPASIRRGLPAGLSVVALFLVKYPYGAYLLIPLLAAEAIRTRLRPGRIFSRGSLAVWGPMAVVGVLWLVVPYTRQSIMTLLADAPDPIISEASRDPLAAPGVQPDLFVFYARTLVARLAPSLILGVLLFAGLLLQLRRGGGFGRVVIFGAILWTVFTLTLSYRSFGVDRFLVPVAGLFAVGGVAGLADLFAGLRRSGPLAARVAVVLLAVVLAGVGEAAWRQRDLPERALATVETTPQEREALTWIRERITPPANVLLVGAWDQFGEESLEIEHLFADSSRHHTDLDVKAVRITKLYQGTQRLERWFTEESRWRLPGEEGRALLVVEIRYGERLRHRVSDPENHAGQIRRLGELLSKRGAVLLDSATILTSEFRIWELPSAE